MGTSFESYLLTSSQKKSQTARDVMPRQCFSMSTSLKKKRDSNTIV